MTEPDELFYPNRMGRVLLQTMQVHLSEQDMSEILEMAHLPPLTQAYPPYNLEREFSFTAISALGAALDTKFGKYGVRGGRMKASFIGHAMALRFLRAFILDGTGTMLPVPSPSTALWVARRMSTEFNSFVPDSSYFLEGDVSVTLALKKCPFCWHQKSDTPYCQIQKGLIQQLLPNVCHGWPYPNSRTYSHFQVEITSCMATGAPEGQLVIQKKPTETVTIPKGPI